MQSKAARPSHVCIAKVGVGNCGKA